MKCWECKKDAKEFAAGEKFTTVKYNAVTKTDIVYDSKSRTVCMECREKLPGFLAFGTYYVEVRNLRARALK